MDAVRQPAVRVGAVLTLAIVVVFSLGLVGDFIWDDVQLIVGNANVRDPALLWTALTRPLWATSNAWQLEGPLARLYYRPWITLAYALEFRLFGQHPAGFHAVNLALHGACVLLVLGWLRRRLRAVDGLDTPGDHGLRVAGLGAAIFALHPSRPEAVTWISGCMDLWMSLFVLLGMLSWDQHRAWRAGGAGGPPRHWVGAVVAFAVATLAKETAVVVPAALLADTLLLPSDAPTRRTAVRDGLWLWGVVIAAFSLRYALPAVHLPDTGSNPVRSAIPRVAATMGYFLSQVAWPVPPSVQVAPTRFDAHGAGLFPTWSLVLGAFGYAGMVALAGMAWKHPRWRPWLADALWFVIPLAPVLNVAPLPMKTLIAPRYLYLPLLGVCAAVARAGALGLRRTGVTRAAMGLVAAAMVAGSGVVSLQEVTHLLSDDDLWTYEYTLHPDNLAVLENLVRVRLASRRHADCMALLRRGVETAGRERDRTHEVTFAILLASMDVTAARDADQAALLADRIFLDALAGPPGTVATLAGPYGRVRLVLSPEERDWVTRSMVDPYRLSRASAHARTLSFAPAERMLLDIVRDEPHEALAWRNLVLVYATTQRWDDALAAADHVHALLPSDTMIPMLQGRIARARTELSALPATSPEHAVALARVFTDLGQQELARRTLGPVLQADPGRPDAVLTLVRAEVFDRRPEAARAALAHAMSVAPDHRAVFQHAWDALPPTQAH